MESQRPDQPPWAMPAAPPTQPYIPQPRKQSNWPTAFGVIAIVFGAFGLFVYGLGAIGQVILPKLAELGDRQPSIFAMFQGLAEWRGWLIAAALGSAALSLLLLTGGVGLLNRRGWAVPLLTFWAVARMLYVPVYTVINCQAQKVQMASMTQWIQEDLAKQQSPGSAAFPAAVMDTIFQIGMVFGLVFGLLWGWALPIIMLVWLARRRIRDEIATWTSLAAR